jgi:hypothetical protein
VLSAHRQPHKTVVRTCRSEMPGSDGGKWTLENGTCIIAHLHHTLPKQPRNLSSLSSTRPKTQPRYTQSDTHIYSAPTCTTNVSPAPYRLPKHPHIRAHNCRISHFTAPTSYRTHILPHPHPTAPTSYRTHILPHSHPTALTSYRTHNIPISQTPH